MRSRHLIFRRRREYANLAMIALIIALLIEQVRPLPVDRLVLAPLRALSRSLVRRFNDGQVHHGREL